MQNRRVRTWPGKKEERTTGKPQTMASAIVPGPAFVTSTSHAAMNSSIFFWKPGRWKTIVQNRENEKRQGSLVLGGELEANRFVMIPHIPLTTTRTLVGHFVALSRSEVFVL